MIDPNTGTEITNPRTLELLRVYKEELAVSFSADPGKFRYDNEKTFLLAIPYILDGNFSKDSRAWRATCKRLKIANTYKAITAYMKGT